MITKNPALHTFTTYFICVVWFINGLVCKILNFVPRHQLIVSRILGGDYAWILTRLIGVGEVLMVVWILSKIKSRICAIFQMTIVGTMNVIEFIVVPDLLLFGRMNIVFAVLFIIVIYLNEFVLQNRRNPQ